MKIHLREIHARKGVLLLVHVGYRTVREVLLEKLIRCLLRVDRLLLMIRLILLHKRLLDVALQNGLVIEPEVGGQELHVTACVLLHPLPLLAL